MENATIITNEDVAKLISSDDVLNSVVENVNVEESKFGKGVVVGIATSAIFCVCFKFGRKLVEKIKNKKADKSEDANEVVEESVDNEE